MKIKALLLLLTTCTLTAQTYVNSYLVCGDKNGDNWGKIQYVPNDAYGLDFQHNNFMLMSNEQGSTNQIMVLGDVDSRTNSPLFAVLLKDSGITPLTWATKFMVTGLGRVGIGTDNPDAMLQVRGNIHAEEVKIDLLNWADFVFEDEYKLPKLSQVKKYIDINGHLEGIPSTKEVLENGVNLGELNKKLLQKVEELTLYTIEQEDKISKLKSELSNYKELEKRISNLEQNTAR